MIDSMLGWGNFGGRNLSCVGCSHRLLSPRPSSPWPPLESQDNLLVEHWDGTTWTVQDTPNGTPGPEKDLTGISCVSDSYCVAVGTRYDVNETPIVLTRNGAMWTTTDLPETFGGLSAVSCDAIGSCTAVGSGATVLTSVGGYHRPGGEVARVETSS